MSRLSSCWRAFLLQEGSAETAWEGLQDPASHTSESPVRGQSSEGFLLEARKGVLSSLVEDGLWAQGGSRGRQRTASAP